MTNPHNLEVGQELYAVYTRGGGPNQVVTILKIGRKWATLESWDRKRVDLETLHMDGGNYMSPGRCYLKEEEYIEHQEKQRLWRIIRDTVSRKQRPDNLSIDDLNEVAKTLGIEVNSSE